MTPGTCCNHNCDEGRTCPRRAGYPTARRYPRTLADAFLHERAGWLEVHRRPTLWGRLLRMLRGAL